MTLVSKEELEAVCPALVSELEIYLEEHPIFKGQEETLLYALAEIINHKLNKAVLSSTEKGAVLSTIITGFVYHNKENLALFNEELRLAREEKASTLH